MKWFAVLGLLLFIGVAVAPSINADVKEPEPISIEGNQFEKLIGLVEGIISHYERTYGDLPDEDCGCEDEEPTPWTFPVICIYLFMVYRILLPINIVFNVIFKGAIPLFANVITKTLDIAYNLKCFWNY